MHAAGVTTVKRTVRLIAIATCFVTLSGYVGTAKDLIEIRLRGHYYAEPATVRITVAVEPGPENRALLVEADGDRYFRSSALVLDGENEKRLHTVEFKNLPAGSYTLRAQLRSKADVLATATQDLFVTGVGGR
jgi:hypothetical protein